MIFRTLGIAFAALLSLTGLGIVRSDADETKTERDARMAWFRDAKFGMVVHWGLYSVPAGEWKGKKYPQSAEELMKNAQIPGEEYESLAKRFNPTKFDADRWAQLAKSAGMKYVVVSAKHHDGFCMFDSKLTVFDVFEATPYHHDPLKDLADACEKHGLALGWRYSMLDWHHPDYQSRTGKSGKPWDKSNKSLAGFDRYVDYAKGQLRELLTNYGRVDVLWFDGCWEHTPAEHRAEELVRFARSLQPNIVINDRLGVAEDFCTPEQHVPAVGPGERDWETALTINDSWGFRRDDRNWKTSKDLVRTLVDVVSKGGNLLLNVGPNADGEFPPECVRRLEAIGQWMAANGESIHGTQASPFGYLPWGRCTAKPGVLYLHVFDWPRKILEVPGLKNAVKEAYLLGDTGKSPLPVARQDDDVLIRLPEKAPDTIDTVIVLKIVGDPDVDTTIRPRADGSFVLPAGDATIVGSNVKYVVASHKNRMDSLVGWTDAKDTATWEIQVDKPGRYRVQVTAACEKEEAGDSFTVRVGTREITCKVQPTDGPDHFRTYEIGAIEIPNPGKQTLTVTPKRLSGKQLMNLRELRLLRQGR